MQSRFLRILILSAFMVSLFASAGFAARRTSLAGNLLIKDRDDVFFMPQSIRDYNRMVTFDFGTSMTLGNGGLVFGTGEQVVWGLFAHKTDFIGAIPTAFAVPGDAAILNSSGSNNFGGAYLPFGYSGALTSPYMAPLNWIDVIAGFGSDEMPWGVRFSLGADSQTTEPAGGTKAENNSIAFNVVAGTTVNEDVEVSAEISFASATVKNPVGTAVDKNEISPFQFAVAVRRTASEEQEDLQLGYLGQFYYATGTDKFTPATGTGTDTDNTALGLTVGAGPVYTPHERTSVACYGTFEWMKVTQKTGGAEYKDQAIVIPGLNIATEVELSSWAQARAGLRSQYALNSHEMPNGTNKDKSSDRSLSYDWYTGLGISIDNFMFDGYFNPSVLTTGTDLLGSASQLFGMVTATFMF